jgi:phage-related holin
MQYLIMFIIVVGLSLSDILTGWMKAHATNDYKSGTMRKGLYRKAAEWLIMLTASGLEIGLKMLGQYYQSEQLADFAGAVTAISIFVYISVMEVISILENFGEINPEMSWIKPILQKLGKFSDSDKE